MLISHILLRNFGKFENFSCDFSPGLNLIKGPNEAGKSTLANAVMAALFINPAKTPEEMSNARRWGTSELPALEAILDIGGKTVKLSKDFQRGKTNLESDFPETNNLSGTAEEWLSGKTGIPSEQIFKATSCIGQGEISHIEESFEAIKNKLESLVTGGKEERAASIIISRIENHVKDIIGENGSGGDLGRFKKQAEDIEYNIEKLTREISSLKVKRADLIQVEMARKNVREDLLVKKQKLERGKKANKLEEIYSTASREFNELDIKLQEIQEFLKKIKGLRDRQTGLKNIEQKDISGINELETGLNYLGAKRQELEGNVAEARNEYESFRIGAIYIGCAAAGVFGLAMSLVSYFSAFLGLIRPVAGYSALGSIIILVFGLALSMTRRQHRAYLQRKVDKLEASLADIDIELQRQAGVLQGMFAKYSVNSVDQLKRSIWQFDDIEKQIAREKELYDGILDGHPQQDLERRHQTLQESLEILKKDRKELSQYVADDVELDRLAQVISQFEERLRDLERERAALRQQLETAEGGAELLASYSERRQGLRQKTSSLQRLVAVLNLTANCIKEARQNVLVSTLEVLNVRTSDILNRLTGGRYSKVRFDKSSMRFEVFSDEKDSWIDPEAGLSVGTVEQIYLAARLALADIISEDKNSMMILDDPFVNYDEKRLENAMKVIKDLSRNRQIFLLTSRNRYDSWADCTISL